MERGGGGVEGEDDSFYTLHGRKSKRLTRQTFISAQVFSLSVPKKRNMSTSTRAAVSAFAAFGVFCAFGRHTRFGMSLDDGGAGGGMWCVCKGLRYGHTESWILQYEEEMMEGADMPDSCSKCCTKVFFTQVQPVLVSSVNNRLIQSTTDKTRWRVR